MPSEAEVAARHAARLEERAATKEARQTEQLGRRARREVARAGGGRELVIVKEQGKKKIRPAEGGPLVPKHSVVSNCARMQERLAQMDEEDAVRAGVRARIEARCAEYEALAAEAEE